MSLNRRLLKVLDERLAGRHWVMGDQYTIADIAILPWVRNLIGFYGAGDRWSLASSESAQRVLAARGALRRWPGLMIRHAADGWRQAPGFSSALDLDHALRSPAPGVTHHHGPPQKTGHPWD